MTFATFTNIILIILCCAVLVQSVRMMRSFQAVKNGGLKDMVSALEKATAQARLVLADMKETLRTDCAANARTVAQAEEIREELTVMVGIANAVAERILETVEANNRSGVEAKAPGKASPRKPVRSRAKASAADAAAETI